MVRNARWQSDGEYEYMFLYTDGMRLHLIQTKRGLHDAQETNPKNLRRTAASDTYANAHASPRSLVVYEFTETAQRGNESKCDG